MNEPKDPKMSGRVAMIVLLGFFIFTGLLVWFSG